MLEQPSSFEPTRNSPSKQVVLTVHGDPMIALLIQGEADASALRSIVCDKLGCGLPDRPGVECAGVAAVWVGADRWMFVSTDKTPSDDLFSGDFSRHGSVLLDQSDGWFLCTIHGPAAIATLRKGVQIDIDPLIFKPGSAALTSLDHIWTCIWRPSTDPDAFRLVVRRSFAKAFKHWFEVSAMEFGFTIQPDYSVAVQLVGKHDTGHSLA